ncbi:MAG: hypothetical protein AAF937_05930 [Planctomycetota bacterium]
MEEHAGRGGKVNPMRSRPRGLKPADAMTQAEVNEFCRATSALYFEVVRQHASRTGVPACLPDLLCPKADVPSTAGYDGVMLEEAERFLLRMGLIAESPPER